ncbi:MAG: SMP-30/gluconolactonase/LRE family protein [Actinomycetota bacterium]
MTDFTTTRITEGLGFGEGPRWHHDRLWYSDFYRHAVYSNNAAGNDERLEVSVPTQPSGLGWLPDGSLLIVSMTDQKVLRWHDGALSVHADISAHCNFWANDMVVSSTGVAYVGNFGFDLDALLRDHGVEGMIASPPPTTNLVVVSPTGDILQTVPGMAFPNGSVITPDGKTLIVGETMTFHFSAFDIAEDGTLSNQRTWAQLDFVATDGCCLDSEGQIWVANALAPQVLRIKEGGQITARVTTEQTAFACMLGGENEQELFVFTSPSSDRFVIADQRVAAIEKVNVGVARAGRP